jgi:PBP1b-binding outer membrane lipoprotein LpoB
VGLATILGAALIVTGCVLAARKQHVPAAQAEAAL